MFKKVVFSPYSSDTNKYINILVDAIKNKNVEVISMREFLFNYKNFLSIKVIHLNWFEDLIGENLFNRTFDFSRKFLLLILLKLFRKRIVWTMHNRESHKSGLGFLKNSLRDMILSFSSIVIIHCNETKEILDQKNGKIIKKIAHIPHPSYIDVYGPRFRNKDSSSINNQVLRLLFLGAVKPYKNIELLIDIAKKFPTTVEIVIAGAPSTFEYKTSLIEMSNEVTNIRWHLEFIPDSKIPGFIESCDLMIIPLNIKSSLNSGSVILSFSYGKSVICPNIGTVKDIQEKDSMFIYDYDNEEDHFDRLSRKVSEAILLKQNNEGLLDVYGMNLYSYVALHNRKEDVGDKLFHLYF